MMMLFTGCHGDRCLGNVVVEQQNDGRYALKICCTVVDELTKDKCVENIRQQESWQKSKK